MEKLWVLTFLDTWAGELQVFYIIYIYHMLSKIVELCSLLFLIAGEVKNGYWPQFDALLDYMTGREIMVMYAMLWGVPEKKIKPYVNKSLQSLNLEPYADKFI